MEKKNYKINYLLYTIIQLTWGILQNSLGILLWIILRIKDPTRKVFYYHGAIVTHWNMNSSMGLGMFIYFGHHHEPVRYQKEVLVHEYGHTIQSCLLGPLFLFVIGLPSCIWCFLPYFQQIRKERRCTYYDFYPESWANHVGEKVLKMPAPHIRIADQKGGKEYD